MHQEDELVEIEGKPGKYRQATSIHDRYAKRPTDLENVCLAQFAVWYEPRKQVPKKVTFINGVSDQVGHVTCLTNDDLLFPKYLDLRPFKLGFMALRGAPKILRLHNPRKKDGHERLVYHNADCDLTKFILI